MYCTLIRFVPISTKFGICTVVNVTLVETKIDTFKCPMCVFKLKYPVQTHDQMANFALIETNEDTVCVYEYELFKGQILAWLVARVALTVEMQTL